MRKLFLFILTITLFGGLSPEGYALAHALVGHSSLPAQGNNLSMGAERSPKSVARFFAVQTSTPEPDGSLIHEVQPGESVWSIATAYGMKPDDLLAINHLPASAVLWTGDKLVIQPSFTPTVTPAAVHTPTPPSQPPTRLPLPTWAATPTPTAAATLPPPIFQDGSRHWLGVGMIVICVLGLLTVMIAALHKH